MRKYLPRVKSPGWSSGHTIRLEPTNDNNPTSCSTMTGDFHRDADALRRKWGLDAEAFLAWNQSIADFGQAVGWGCGQEATILAPKVGSPEARATAAALGVAHFLFTLVQSLPSQEARLVLDRLSGHTTETVEAFVRRGM